MSIIDSIKTLEQQLGTQVRRALEELHQQAGEKLNQQIADELAEIRTRVPQALADSDLLRPVTRRAAAEARSDAFGALRDGLRSLDQATSQAEVLKALLSQSSRFADRTALLLVRGETLAGWASQGFDEDPVQSSSFPIGEPWSSAISHDSSLRLDDEQAAAIADALGFDAGRVAAVLPLVLRDRIAALIYADRTEASAALETEALQVLVYTAAQAIELLPHRQREATSTLALRPEEAPAPVDESDDARDDAQDDARASASDDRAQADGDPLATRTDSAPVDVSGGSQEAPTEAPVAEPGIPEAGSTTPVATPEPTLSAEDQAVEMQATEAPEPEQSLDFQPPQTDVADEISSFVEDTDAERRVDREAAVQETANLALPDEEDDALVEVEAEPIEEIGAAPEPSQTPDVPSLAWEDDTAVGLRRDPRIADSEEASEATPPSAYESVADPSSLQTQVIPSGSAQRTTPAPPAEEPEPTVSATSQPTSSTPPPPEPAEETEDEPPATQASSGQLFSQAGAKATQVAPPGDLDGPGLAFASKAPASAQSFEGDEQHDKAKRLARLLVSEIKLYNEEEVEVGKRNGDIYARLKEDIDRSRQMYEDRVDERVRNTNDYFYQELVRTLASGDPQALGM